MFADVPVPPGLPSATASSAPAPSPIAPSSPPPPAVFVLPLGGADAVVPAGWPIATASLATGPWACVARTGVSLRVRDLADLDEPIAAEVAAAGFDRVACKPIWSGRRLVAVAVVFGRTADESGVDVDAALDRAVAQFSAARSGSPEADEPPAVDRLTAVATSGGLQDEIDRGDDDAVVLYVDLDGLDHVNLTYGDAGGDAVLVEVARRLERTVRPEDRVFRLTGDEFVVVIRGAEQLDSIQTAADLIDELALPYGVIGPDGVDELVSVTAGVGMCVPSEGTPFDVAVFAALTALGEAKLAGRDRLHIVGR